MNTNAKILNNSNNTVLDIQVDAIEKQKKGIKTGKEEVTICRWQKSLRFPMQTLGRLMEVIGENKSW